MTPELLKQYHDYAVEQVSPVWVTSEDEELSPTLVILDLISEVKRLQALLAPDHEAMSIIRRAAAILKEQEIV